MGRTDFFKCTVFNLPNRLTLLRLLLAIVFFVLLSHHFYYSALVSFLLASITDWLDGYFARRNGLTTDFGRIADPFVDKIIVCGGFILLVQHSRGLLPAWMVVVIVAREFFVTSLRSYAESKGIEFGANIWGKTKMFIQSFTISSVLLLSAHVNNFILFKQGVFFMLWVTLIITVVSGINYMIKAGPAFLDR
ncbi:MAG: CDP-diacylglycerol--glycerol-3-phosphate 3-phosphatidyltransferase [Candidatus Brocadiaceae bacterium]|nr:CDP-diacylglycerol--glycerol-3-phosphate 3-phosphatidyltransferase [Candidatus Brocadiaceae bacterium]